MIRTMLIALALMTAVIVAGGLLIRSNAEVSHTSFSLVAEAQASTAPKESKKIKTDSGEMCLRMVSNILQAVVMDNRYKGPRGKVLDCRPVSLIGFRPWRIFQCSIDLGPSVTIMTLPQQIHCDGIFKEHGLPPGAQFREEDLEEEPMKSPFPKEDAVQNERSGSGGSNVQ